MLAIDDTALDVVRATGLAATHIARHDADLARQLRRAVTSVLLNIAEAYGVTGGNRRLRYATALGSAYETRAALAAASALGYIAAPRDTDTDKLEKVIATLMKLAR